MSYATPTYSRLSSLDRMLARAGETDYQRKLTSGMAQGRPLSRLNLELEPVPRWLRNVFRLGGQQ